MTLILYVVENQHQYLTYSNFILLNIFLKFTSDSITENYSVILTLYPQKSNTIDYLNSYIIIVIPLHYINLFLHMKQIFH